MTKLYTLHGMKKLDVRAYQSHGKKSPIYVRIITQLEMVWDSGKSSIDPDLQ